MKIHVNLSDWKGTLTKWALLNYVEGGLDDYGFYINNSVKNYIDYENKKYIQMVARVKLKDIAWIYQIANTRFRGILNGFKKALTNDDVANAKCNLYDVYSWNTFYSASNGLSFIPADNIENYVYIRDTNYTDATLFTNHFTDNDYLYYELESPIETDISDYL